MYCGAPLRELYETVNKLLSNWLNNVRASREVLPHHTQQQDVCTAIFGLHEGGRLPIGSGAAGAREVLHQMSGGRTEVIEGVPWLARAPIFNVYIHKKLMKYLAFIVFALGVYASSSFLRHQTL